MPLDRKEITTRFVYHPPTDDQPAKFENIRSRAWTLAMYINDVCPDSREKSTALTKLDEVVMWANAAIARRSEAPLAEG